VVNEDPLTKKIRSLQDQIDSLNIQLASAQEREGKKSEELQALSEQLRRALTGGGGEMEGGMTVLSLRSPGGMVTPRGVSPQLRELVKEGEEEGREGGKGVQVGATGAGGEEEEEKGGKEGEEEEEVKRELQERAIEAEVQRRVQQEVEKAKEQQQKEAAAAAAMAAAEATAAAEAAAAKAAAAAEQQHQQQLKEVAAAAAAVAAAAAAVAPAPAPATTTATSEEEAAPFTLAMPAHSSSSSPSSPPPTLPSPMNNSITFSYTQTTRRPNIPSSALQKIPGLKDGLNVPLSPFQQGATLLEGFLFKRGQLTGVYQRRWFVVRGSRLLWYVRYNDEESIRGAINLKGYVFEHAPGEEVERGFPYGFVVRKEGEAGARVHTLQASSEDEREKWMQCLGCASLVEGGAGKPEQQGEPLRKMAQCAVM